MGQTCKPCLIVVVLTDTHAVVFRQTKTDLDENFEPYTRSGAYWNTRTPNLLTIVHNQIYQKSNMFANQSWCFGDHNIISNKSLGLDLLGRSDAHFVFGLCILVNDLQTMVCQDELRLHCSLWWNVQKSSVKQVLNSCQRSLAKVDQQVFGRHKMFTQPGTIKLLNYSLKDLICWT